MDRKKLERRQPENQAPRVKMAAPIEAKNTRDGSDLPKGWVYGLIPKS